MQYDHIVCWNVHFCTLILSAFCSVVGATIVSIGLYAVLWGKAKEEIEEDVGSQESPTIENVPLLQSHRTETSEKNV